MGVNIQMRPGSIMRSKGDPVDITPGWRSRFVAVFESNFGGCPAELHSDDEPKLSLLAAGASVFASDHENSWLILLRALREYGVVTVQTEY